MSTPVESQIIGKPDSLAKLSPRERFFRFVFERRLEDCKPFMFHMTDQIVADFPYRQWNLLIGDDTAGRLPTRFVRQVFKQVGVEIPARYIAASKSVNKSKPFSTFDRYAQELVQAVELPRALIITEAAGHQLSSVRFIHEAIEPYCETLDTAIIASRAEPTGDLGRVYTGAIDRDEAMGAIWKAFENPTGTRRIRPNWSGALNNLDRNPNPGEGHAMRTTNLAYRGLAAYCYRRMNTLASEYWQQSNLSPDELYKEDLRVIGSIT